MFIRRKNMYFAVNRGIILSQFSGYNKAEVESRLYAYYRKRYPASGMKNGSQVAKRLGFKIVRFKIEVAK